jgi:hypothetical protein
MLPLSTFEYVLLVDIQIHIVKVDNQFIAISKVDNTYSAISKVDNQFISFNWLPSGLWLVAIRPVIGCHRFIGQGGGGQGGCAV